jgi:hypothetical protein
LVGDIIPDSRATSPGIGNGPLGTLQQRFYAAVRAVVMAMIQAMPVAVAARMIEEWDTRLWRVIHHYVEAARDRVEHSAVTSIPVDETAPWRKSPGHCRGLH